MALDRLRSREPGLSALGRALRAAIVMPSVFALGTEVFKNGQLAMFAAFGPFDQCHRRAATTSSPEDALNSAGTGMTRVVKEGARTLGQALSVRSPCRSCPRTFRAPR